MHFSLTNWCFLGKVCNLRLGLNTFVFCQTRFRCKIFTQSEFFKCNDIKAVYNEILLKQPSLFQHSFSISTKLGDDCKFALKEKFLN